MLSPFRVARLVAAEEFDRLLNELLMNGRPVSLAVRLRLSEPGVLAACALGLALRRLTELSWRVEPPALEVARRLAGLQEQDGSFGSVAATACAVGGLGALVAQIGVFADADGSARGVECGEERRDGEVPGDEAVPDMVSHMEAGLDGIVAAWRRGVEWLRARVPRRQDDLFDLGHEGFRSRLGGLSGSTSIEEALDASLVLWQLGNDREALSAMGITDASAMVDALGLRHHRETASLVESLVATRSRAVAGLERKAGGAPVGGGASGDPRRGERRSGSSERRAA